TCGPSRCPSRSWNTASSSWAGGSTRRKRSPRAQRGSGGSSSRASRDGARSSWRMSASAVASSVLGPIEMTSDSRFARRVIRLAATSVIALGLIFFQYALMPGGSAPILIVLGAGWILMPAILVLSLRLPALRYGLVVPSALVSFALAAICLGNIPTSATARSGWLLVTCGVWLGGLLGVWFWLRWLPVPANLT